MPAGRVRLVEVAEGPASLLSGGRGDLPAKALRGALWPLSLAYGGGVGAIRWAYRRGLRRPKEAPIPVVSVGNVVWGGTGKTQAVIWLCRRLCERGLKVAVLHRGYGGRGAGPRVVGPDDSPIEVGDEPVLLSRSLPEGAFVVVGKRREEGARLAAERGAQVAILDDGLQYWRLEKDIEVVMWRGPLPPREVRLIPAGPWREPPSILREVDQVWSVEGGKAAEGVDVAFEVVPEGLRRLDGEGALPPEALRGRKVLGFCGIGWPRSFAETLERAGAEGEVLAFPDHRAFTDGDFALIARRAEKLGADFVLTTGKDAVRLEGRRPPFDVFVLSVSLKAVKGEGRAEELLSRIEGLARGRGG